MGWEQRKAQKQKQKVSWNRDRSRNKMQEERNINGIIMGEWSEDTPKKAGGGAA